MQLFPEAPGGIDLSSIATFVATGIDTVSIGALTHSVRNSNIHMEFDDA